MNYKVTPDPREIITPDAFAVAPHLLGLPLAKPWRRGVAMLVDLLLVAILVNAGGVVFGLAAAGLFFRMSRRTAQSGTGFRRPIRAVLRGLAALVLFITCVSLWGRISGKAEGEDGESPNSAENRSADENVSVPVMLGADVQALQNAADETGAAEAARRAASNLQGKGVDPAELPSTLRELAEEMAGGGQPLAAAALRAVADSLGQAGAQRADTAMLGTDSIVRAYVAALEEDSTSALTLRPRVINALAADTLAQMQRRLERAEAQNAELQQAARENQDGDEEEDDPGLLHLIRVVADDLGLSFGWTGLYFTAFLAMWRGQTPGKRLLGLRVLRLNGAPVTWWASFERFGGYAAGLLTGLLGFAQIWWDRNRQAIHDKISETVVIQE